ncbi:MAG: hypothetical protein EOM03_05955 [Clostridia bacterium]|nr:hypothetical protein [Clostridia bacterium]
MKRFLSWVVLSLIFAVFYSIGKFVFDLGFGLLGRALDVSFFRFILVSLIIGGPLLGLLIASFRFGPALSFAASEHVFPSRRGLRYRVFAIINIILPAILLFADIYKGLWNSIPENIYAIVFSAILLYCVKDYHGSTNNSAHQNDVQQTASADDQDLKARLKHLNELKAPYFK